MSDREKIDSAILEHMMNPKNYAKMENPSCVGFGYSDNTSEYVLIYLKLEDENIIDVNFMAVGCTDTIVSGSIFTEMIKGSTIEFGNKSAKKLLDNLKNAPAKQQACAEIVIRAYEGAIINLENRKTDPDEEFFKLKIDGDCEIDD